ncbi:MAG TPA: putative Ig domain-containing protein [Hydrogenophaga sp.]|uniref:putative Ig domain-containing protein n=1 Tax=Hydrogenophaga sp. TaxID=1904254 RepID=UPI002C05E835|nr:putative Ig domain-containing protein [Hydrogenophaga sp.]HSX94290.1 putative Ig domain-containing protein [Hydrogenophaga sp.]
MNAPSARTRCPPRSRLNRRRLLALPGCAVLLLPACGGGSAPAPEPSTETPSTTPTALSYGAIRSVYVVGQAIPPNRARLDGVPAARYSVAPDLPLGLSLDLSTGAIVGVPQVPQAQTQYTVTASHARGRTQAQIQITVAGQGVWKAAASLPDARYYASWAPLPGGRFLMAGGRSRTAITDAAHIFDPAADTWTPAAPMWKGRAAARAVPLSDGRVLVLGGDTAARATTASAEIYDPFADAWIATEPMNAARSWATAHRLADGRVLAVGGTWLKLGLGRTYQHTVERYDPGTGAWTLLETPLWTARSQHAAALLPGGTTLLVAGGVNAVGREPTAEIYAVDGSGTTVIPYGVQANVQQAVSLNDGSVLVVDDLSLRSHRFDPYLARWTTSARSALRLLPSMAVMADGRVLLAGGGNLNTAEVYAPEQNVWTATAPMARARRAAVASLLADGSVLLVSGDSHAGPLDGCERYAP